LWAGPQVLQSMGGILLWFQFSKRIFLLIPSLSPFPNTRLTEDGLKSIKSVFLSRLPRGSGHDNYIDIAFHGNKAIDIEPIWKLQITTIEHLSIGYFYFSIIVCCTAESWENFTNRGNTELVFQVVVIALPYPQLLAATFRSNQQQQQQQKKETFYIIFPQEKGNKEEIFNSLLTSQRGKNVLPSRVLVRNIPKRTLNA